MMKGGDFVLRRPVVGDVRRYDVSPRKDKRVFTKTADKSHYINVVKSPICMRGGIRL